MNVYWAVSLVRGHFVVWEQVDVSEEVQINELWKDPGHEGLGRSSEEKCLIGLTK